jgi:hypothetical protein
MAPMVEDFLKECEQSSDAAYSYSENEVLRVFGFLGQHLSFHSKWERDEEETKLWL